MSSLVGAQAPGFTLYDTEQNNVSLADYKGKNVLILFFPAAFTSVCTVELCGIRDNIAVYQNIDAAVLGISVDPVTTLAKFREEQHLNFPLLSDLDRVVSTNYGSLYPSSERAPGGVSKRSAFVIDKEGTVRYAEVLEDAGEQPNFTAIQQTLKALN